MKKSILLLLSIVLFSACNKEDEISCSTCTRVVEVLSTHPDSGGSETQTTTYSESNTGDCSMSLEDYEAKVKSESDTEIQGLNAVNPLMAVDVSGNLITYEITTTVISFDCTE